MHLGGEEGERVEVYAGDIIVIPAGVGHKNLKSENLRIVGAYPNGRDYDIKKGKEDERPQAEVNIATVPIPERDPIQGKSGGVPQLWRDLRPLLIHKAQKNTLRKEGIL